MTCIFCKIIAGEIPCNKVWENESVLAFRDISPASPDHILVIPKTHYENLNQADNIVLGNLLSAVKTITKELNLLSSGYRTVINTGNDGGQTVAHLHLHILAGRVHHWPPG